MANGNGKEMRKIFNKVGVGGFISNGAITAISIGSNLHEGKGIVRSVVGSIADMAIQDALAGVLGIPLAMGIQLAPALVQGAGAMASIGRDKAKHNMKAVSTGRVGGYFNDNQYAATMRQRQLQAAGGDMAQQRQLFGNEARRRATNISY